MTHMVTLLHMTTLIRTGMIRVQRSGTAATRRATIRTCKLVRADGCRWYRTADLFAMRSMVGAQFDHGASIRIPTSNDSGNAAFVVSRVLVLLRRRASAVRMSLGRSVVVLTTRCRMRATRLLLGCRWHRMPSVRLMFMCERSLHQHMTALPSCRARSTMSPLASRHDRRPASDR
jgi:hypothetical protein